MTSASKTSKTSAVEAGRRSSRTSALVALSFAGTIFLRTVFIRAGSTCPTNPRNKLFENQQEAVRKAVERVFAVLFQRFNIIFQPSRVFDVFDKGNLEDVTVHLLHNSEYGCGE
jgi:Plant transposon protein